jgi:acetyl-CoA carboxylase biotin carboxyl carrier protein
MNYNDIQQIIKTMIDSNLTSLELEYEGVSLKLKKGAEETTAVSEPKKVIQPVKSEPIISKVTESPKEVIEEKNMEIVKSPIVGTFYTSSGPGKEPFVSVGSKVKKGQILCIIEAMKLMNEIESEMDGEVADILVKDGDMVEYGAPLFKLRLENK